MTCLAQDKYCKMSWQQCECGTLPLPEARTSSTSRGTPHERRTAHSIKARALARTCGGSSPSRWRPGVQCSGHEPSCRVMRNVAPSAHCSVPTAPSFTVALREVQATTQQQHGGNAHLDDRVPRSRVNVNKSSSWRVQVHAPTAVGSLEKMQGSSSRSRQALYSRAPPSSSRRSLQNQWACRSSDWNQWSSACTSSNTVVLPLTRSIPGAGPSADSKSFAPRRCATTRRLQSSMPGSCWRTRAREKFNCTRRSACAWPPPRGPRPEEGVERGGAKADAHRLVGIVVRGGGGAAAPQQQ